MWHKPIEGKIFFSHVINIAAAAANEIHVSDQAEFDALGNIKVINHISFVCRRGNTQVHCSVFSWLKDSRGVTLEMKLKFLAVFNSLTTEAIFGAKGGERKGEEGGSEPNTQSSFES